MDITTDFLADAEDCDGDCERNKLFAAARRLLRRGYNAVPQALNGAKHPAVKWAELQERRVTKEELSGWYPLFERGVGFITGAVSDVIVIETDGPGGEAILKEFEASHGPMPDGVDGPCNGISVPR